jgi:predicted nucleotidyltransferase
VERISDSVLREAATRLGEAARKPARVILFGSYAHGAADPSSDVDFLVIQRDGFSHRQEITRLQDTLGPLRIPAELVVISQTEAAAPELAGDVVRDALRAGVVLYESA